MSAASDTPSEARAVIGEMVAQVRAIDPQFSIVSAPSRWKKSRMG